MTEESSRFIWESARRLGAAASALLAEFHREAPHKEYHAAREAAEALNRVFLRGPPEDGDHAEELLEQIARTAQAIRPLAYNSP